MMQWIVSTEIFIHPFTCILSGPTMSGKSFLLKKILQHNDLLISPKPEIIIYCYKAWQPGFDTLKNQITNIQFNEGILLTITLQT